MAGDGRARAIEFHTGHSCSPRRIGKPSPPRRSRCPRPGHPPAPDPDPEEREAAKEKIRGASSWRASRRGRGAGRAAVRARPALPDLSPLATGAELESEFLLAQLRELAPAARAAGVSLFLEPLNRYEAHVVNRLEQGAAFAEQVGPEIRIMADFFHMRIEEADIAASIRASRQHIVYVHVADSNRLQPGAAISISAPVSPLSRRSATRPSDRVPGPRSVRRGDPERGLSSGVGGGVTIRTAQEIEGRAVCPEFDLPSNNLTVLEFGAKVVNVNGGFTFPSKH